MMSKINNFNAPVAEGNTVTAQICHRKYTVITRKQHNQQMSIMNSVNRNAIFYSEVKTCRMKLKTVYRFYINYKSKLFKE